MLERMKGLLGGGSLPSVDVRTLAEALEGSPRPVVIDVRTDFEFKTGRVGVAVNIPLPEVTSRVPAYLEGREGEVYLICRSGARSGTAQQTLAKLGIESINVTGGMLAWASVGLPVEL